MRRFTRPSKLWTTTGLALLVVLSLATSAATSAADDVEGKLMAPCCGANTVREHDSGSAMQMRDEIRQMLAEGRSEKEILAFYAAKYGDKILAMPEARGFNLVPYLVPILLLVVGGVFLLVAMRRWRGDPASLIEKRAAPKLDPEYLARLERDLEHES